MGRLASSRSIDGAARWDVRPMAVDDVQDVIAVIDAADAEQTEGGRRPPRTPPSEAEMNAARFAHARFVERDGPGSWVAVADDRVVGVAESIRRDSFWGLSMLFVHPDFQSRGVGGRLLEAALSYASGTSRRMILSSPDPRALRRYFMAGLAMHPAAELEGVPDRRAIPPSLPGRHGGEDDLDLVASVEEHLGRSRTEDVSFALHDDRFHLDVVDSGPGRGWMLWRSDRVVMLGATNDQTAEVLLWRQLAGGEGRTQAYGLTAAQQWAFGVAHKAHLSVRVEGAVFAAGMAIPGPWIPSGWFF